MSVVDVSGLADSDGQVFKAVPAGRYPMRVVKVEDKETGPNSKHPGQPMLSLILKVMPGKDYEGEQLFYNSVYPNSTMEERAKKMSVDRLKQLIIAAGIELDGDSFDSSELQGAEVCAVVTTKTEGGKTTNNIQEFLPLEDVED